MKLLKEFIDFVTERWAIHERRLDGQPAPWTKDPILQRYRFCNVRREDDRVTKWIHNTWLKPIEANLPLSIFNMCIARLVNWPPSLTLIGVTKQWRLEHFTEAMEVAKRVNGKAFTSAYMIHADSSHDGTKAQYLAECVLTPIWEGRKRLSSALMGGGLLGLHRALMTYRDMGSFMAAQVVADVKWTPTGSEAADWESFAAPGPGSKRGLNRIMGRELNAPWDDVGWHNALLELRGKALPKLPKALRSLDAQNLQNCLCEVDKYLRVKNGEGRPRQNFTPSKENY